MKLSVKAAVLLAVLLTAAPARSRQPDTRPAKTFSVATYNINWGNGTWENGTPGKTIKVIHSLNADIVLLQETTPKWQNLIEKKLKKTLPYQKYYHYENAGGLGFLSKYPIKSIRHLRYK